MNKFRIHIAKRDTMPVAAAWAIRIGAIVLALLLGSLLTLVLTGKNPLSVLLTIVQGAFGTERKIWTTLRDTSVLLMFGLAVAPAFKMRFWNIGAEGQVLMSGLGTAVVMFFLGGKINDGLLIILMLVAAIVCGMLWAFIPAVIKAKWNTNETLSTLMLNYIAAQIVSMFIAWAVPSGSMKMGIINQDTNAGWLPALFGNKHILIIIMALLITAFVFVYIKYGKGGYELTVVGESVKTARYVGIKVEWVIIRTMLISGAICGIIGFLQVAGVEHTISPNTAGGLGFTAVLVAWMAKLNPIVMIFTSMLIVVMSNGAGDVASSLGLNASFSDILTGIILFFLIGCEFFINYKICFGVKNDKISSDVTDSKESESIGGVEENEGGKQS